MVRGTAMDDGARAAVQFEKSAAQHALTLVDETLLLLRCRLLHHRN